MRILEEVLHPLLFKENSCVAETDLPLTFPLYLKIALLPNELFSNRLLKKIVERELDVEVIYSQCMNDFFMKKNHWAKTIRDSSEFIAWYENQTGPQLDLLLRSFHDDVEIKILKNKLYFFSIELLRMKIEKWFVLLDDLIFVAVSESFEIYTALMSLRTLLLPYCKKFFEKNNHNEVEIKSFISISTSWVYQLQALPIFNNLLTQFNQSMEIVRHCFYFFNNDEGDFDEISDGDVLNRSFFQEEASQCLLADNTFSWIIRENEIRVPFLLNKMVIIGYFERIYGACETSGGSFSSKSLSTVSSVSSRVFSIAASLPAFFTPSEKIKMPKQIVSAPILADTSDANEKVNSIREKLVCVETPMALLSVIKQLFLIFQIKERHRQFTSELIAQYWKEHLTRESLYLLQYAANRKKTTVLHKDHEHAIDSFMLKMYCKSEEELAPQTP